MGACLVPFSYFTVWELTNSVTAAGMAGALVVFGKSSNLLLKNFQITQSDFELTSTFLFVDRYRNVDIKSVHSFGSYFAFLHFWSYIFNV